MTLQQIIERIDWNRLFEISLVLIGVAVGFVLSELVKLVQEKRSIANLKSVLNWEIIKNLDVIQGMLPSEFENINDTWQQMGEANLLKTFIFEMYLNRINLLGKEEMGNILYAYTQIIDLKKFINEEERLLVNKSGKPEYSLARLNADKVNHYMKKQIPRAYAAFYKSILDKNQITQEMTNKFDLALEKIRLIAIQEQYPSENK